METIIILVPFDEHRFHNVFTKLYNRLFTMEDQKYLPPKYSYALKELASDYGIYERADVSSLISGSTNVSTLSTTSGFIKNFSSSEGGLKSDQAFSIPLKSISE
jgi:hypothetical protein